jgi:hypothetical protein
MSKLNLTQAHAANYKGGGVVLAIVDSGIDASRIAVTRVWSLYQGRSPTSYASAHGTMVAFDALLAAPDAEIWDYPVVRSHSRNWSAFLSHVVMVFNELKQLHSTDPRPKVIVNSWGLYDRNLDFPDWHPQNYSENSGHPLNLLTAELSALGMDVVFAAGNCGSACPHRSCGSSVGPAKSIHGANSHPAVISVAAVSVNDEHLGYSSEGPGGLSAQTPDISGFSHFSGSGVFPADFGTSAACPVVAGAVAALRSAPQAQQLTPAGMKQLLIDTARSMHGPGWSPKFGWGIVDVDAALASIPPLPAPSPQPTVETPEPDLPGVAGVSPALNDPAEPQDANAGGVPPAPPDPAGPVASGDPQGLGDPAVPPTGDGPEDADDPEE